MYNYSGIKNKEMNMELIKLVKPPVSFVKKQIELAGSKIGSVWFYKKDGSLRKMCYRLRVKNPKYISPPKTSNSPAQPIEVKQAGVKVITFNKHKTMNENHNLLTVYDVNLRIKDKNGKCTGERGGYRSIPLLQVFRICAGGKLIEIE